MGWAFYRKGIYGLAVEHLAHAVARDGTQTSPSTNVRKYHLAMAYFKNGDSRRGMTTLEAALKLAPDIPEAHMAESVMAESR